MGIKEDNIRAFFEKRGIHIGEVIKTDFIVTSNQPEQVQKIWSEIADTTQIYVVEEVVKKPLLQRLQFWRR